MTQGNYSWTDNPTVAGESVCNTDVLNECLMHLKYENGAGKDGFHLFDTKITDRILAGDEAIGWALQGSIVTMAYPDAVNKIKELYSQGYETTYRGITCKKSIDGRYIADISQYTEIDKLFVETGVSDFYILDEINEQFHLPKTKWFYQFTDNQEQLNSYNEAGLPNITGTFQTYLNNWANATSGAFYKSGYTKGGEGGMNFDNGQVCIDASRSSTIFGKSDTVQPPSSNKLLYYKVGDTIINSDQALIDAKELLSDGFDAVENKINEGLESISNASQALRQTQISNCILESPNGVADFEANTITIKQGLKVLIPNGRNADNTLNNIEYEITEDIIFNNQDNSNSNFYLFLKNDGTVFAYKSDDVYFLKKLDDKTPTENMNYCVYSEELNLWFVSENGTEYETKYIVPVCTFSTGNENFTVQNLKNKSPFKAIDSNNKEFISYLSSPSHNIVDLTLGASGQKYIAPADGYYFVQGVFNNGGYLNMVNDDNRLATINGPANGNGVNFGGYIEVSKNDNVRVTYELKSSTTYFRFIHKNGAK